MPRSPPSAVLDMPCSRSHAASLAPFLLAAVLAVGDGTVAQCTGCGPGITLRFPGLDHPNYLGSPIAPLSDGSRALVEYDNSYRVTLREADGDLIRKVTDIDSSSFYVLSVFEVDRQDRYLYTSAGDSTGLLSQIDLVTGATRTVGFFPIVGDVGFEPGGSVLVLYGPLGTYETIDRVDPATGTVQPLYFDASEPLLKIDVSSKGDLYASTRDYSFVNNRIYRWSAQQVQSGQVLDLASADDVFGGFSFVGDMAIDPVTDDLFAFETSSSAQGVYLVRGDESESEFVADAGTVKLRSLHVIPYGNAQGLRPYQPENLTSALEVYDVDLFSSVYEYFEFVPQRPVALVSGPGTRGAGAVDLRVDGGPPLGTAFAFYGPASGYSCPELAIRLAALEAPLYVGLDLATVSFDPTPIALDGNGDGIIGLLDPTPTTGDFAIQVLCLDAGGRLVQFSQVAFL